MSQLLSHANGEKHKQKMPVVEESTIFSTMKNPPQQHQPSTSQSLCHNQPSASRTLESSVLTRQVLEVEIRWALKCISSKYSKRSCDEIKYLFSIMFSDSQIAKKFTCGCTKCSYLILYGMYPYFQDLLLDEISKSPFFSLPFDESHNKILHHGQMDFQVRYWDLEKREACTRYFTSEFLQSATSEDLGKKIDSVLSKLNMLNLLQLSSDGPAVNLNFYGKWMKREKH